LPCSVRVSAFEKLEAPHHRIRIVELPEWTPEGRIECWGVEHTPFVLKSILRGVPISGVNERDFLSRVSMRGIFYLRCQCGIQFYCGVCVNRSYTASAANQEAPLCCYTSHSLQDIGDSPWLQPFAQTDECVFARPEYVRVCGVSMSGFVD
jgi:hypothetical protein